MDHCVGRMMSTTFISTAALIMIIYHEYQHSYCVLFRTQERDKQRHARPSANEVDNDGRGPTRTRLVLHQAQEQRPGDTATGSEVSSKMHTHHDMSGVRLGACLQIFRASYKTLRVHLEDVLCNYTRASKSVSNESSTGFRPQPRIALGITSIKRMQHTQSQRAT